MVLCHSHPTDRHSIEESLGTHADVPSTLNSDIRVGKDGIMLASLRRVYYYFVASVALIFLTYAIQNVVYEVLVRTGLQGYSYSQPGSLRQAAVLLAVAVVIVAPVGGLHWWLIRRDARQDPTALGGVVREIFLDLLTFGSLITVTISLGSVLYYAFETSHASYESGPTTQLSLVIGWGIALIALSAERLATRDQHTAAKAISGTFAGLTGLAFLITIAVLGSSALQMVVDHAASLYPGCSLNGFTDNQTFPCQIITPNSPGSPLGSTFAYVLGFAAIVYWLRDIAGTAGRLIVDAAYIIVGTITALAGVFDLMQGLLHYFTHYPLTQFAQSLVSTESSGIPTTPFAGSLAMGAILLGYFVTQAWAVPNRGQHPELGRQVALVAIAVPLAATFLIGASEVLGGLFLLPTLFPQSADFWFGAVSMALSGVAWVALWPLLARMSNPTGTGPQLPRRVYVYIVLGGTIVSAVISLAVGIYYAITSAIGTAADVTNRATFEAFATTIVMGAAAGYYWFVLVRDQRILRQHAPVAPPPASGDAPIALEDLLLQVAGGQLSVNAAAALLRQRFGARDVETPAGE
jgi:hypothetical protein